MFIASLLQPFTGGSGRDVSCELKKRYLSLTLITWEAHVPEMGQYIGIKLTSSIPLVMTSQ